MTDTTYGAFEEDLDQAPIVTEGSSPVTAAAPSGDFFGELVSEFKKIADRPNIVVPVPLRPGWFLELSPNISNAEFRRYQRAGQGKRKMGQGQQDVNVTISNGLAIVEHTTAMYRDTPEGRVAVTDADGDLVTFTSPDLLFSTGSQTALQAATRFIGDAHIISIGNTLFDHAGWGDEVSVVEEDPTAP